MWQDILKNSSFEKKLKVARDNGTINKNPIKTMSTAQARKPIYKSSLDVFEKYKDYLKEINLNL